MAMAKATKVSFVLGFALMAVLHLAAAQTAHIVGDTTGWMIPPSPTFYTNWAAGKTFTVGDSLVFNFPTNAHDVQRVRSRQSLDQCNDDDAIGEEIRTGPATVNLTVAGDYFFFCTVGTHCQMGQRLAVTVVAAGGATPPSSRTPPAMNTPPPVTTQRPPAVPAPGSSSHAVKAAFSVTLLGVVLSLF